MRRPARAWIPLENAVKHGAALATDAEIGEDDLPDELRRSLAQAPAPAGSPAPPVLKTLSEVERDYIVQVLDACGGSRSEAARILGVGRNTLWRKLRAHA